MGQWHVRELRITLKSHLRCGDSPLGFVSRTLPFVPGHIPLMAMVPAFIDNSGAVSKAEEYQKVQQFLEQNVRFTPFYIYHNNKVLFPYKHSDDLRTVESIYLNSIPRTAVDYTHRTAREGMLFETESINAVTDANTYTVLTGYIFWRKAVEENNNGLKINTKGRFNGKTFEQLIQSSQWGGERNIGYGRIHSVKFSDVDKVWNQTLNLDKDEPQIEWKENSKIPFWLEYDSSKSSEIDGHLKPLSGRLYDSDKGEGGAGQAIWEPKVVWDIGWQSKNSVKLNIGVKTVHC